MQASTRAVHILWVSREQGRRSRGSQPRSRAANEAGDVAEGSVIETRRPVSDAQPGLAWVQYCAVCRALAWPGVPTEPRALTRLAGRKSAPRLSHGG